MVHTGNLKNLKIVLLSSFHVQAVLFVLMVNYLNVSAQNLLPDPKNKPFYHGVASGDPLSDRVIIWTRITPDDTTVPAITVNWEMSLNPTFDNITASGTYSTTLSRDWTVKIDVAGLNPYTNYYYRFKSPDGVYSMTGRTKTAPVADLDNLRFVVISCSSLFSGYFNAYKKIGQRRDLDGVLHVGDYIYEFIDENEEIRVPEPYLEGPENLEDWRWLHRYYHLDPDFRAAQQQHPFIIMWDNHDLSGKNSPDFQESLQAFYEWTPVREYDSIPKENLYRKISYGGLLDIYMLDINYKREIPAGADDFTDTTRKILGDDQMNWFLNDIKKSTATWRIIGSQKQFGQWNLVGVPGSEGVPFYGGRAWDGFIADRNKIIGFLRDNNLKNNVIISGDNHMTFMMDIVENPFDFNQYNPNGSSKSVGVEFQPASISRGNFDETLRGIFSINAIRQLENASRALNRHHVYVDFVDHGYGLLDIRKDRTQGEIYNIPILEVDDNEWMDVALESRINTNRWRRAFIKEPSIAINPSSPLAPEEGQIATSIPPFRVKHLNAKVFPNPVNEVINIYATLPQAGAVNIELYDVDGKMLHQSLLYADDTNFKTQLNVRKINSTSKIVLIRVTSGNREYHTTLLLN